MLEEYIKKNGQSFINVSITFSSIVFLANFVLWNHRINTALYFSNVFSLVLSTVMMVMYPNFLYDKYKDVFFGKFNRYAMNAQGLFIHLIDKLGANCSNLARYTMRLSCYSLIISFSNII